METRSSQKVATLLMAVALLMLAWGVSPAGAMAHADLVSSTPASGARVQPGLTEITLTFDEEIGVDQSSVELAGPGGAAVPGAASAVNRAERTKMTITTPPLAEGTYTVKWSAFSEDDNNLSTGTFSFTVASAGDAGAPGTGAPAPSGQPAASTGTAGESTGSLPRAGSSDQLYTGSILPVAVAAALAVVALGLVARRRAGHKGYSRG